MAEKIFTLIRKGASWDGSSCGGGAGIRGISTGCVRREEGFLRFQRDLVGAAESAMTPLLLLSRFSRVRLSATPSTAAHQASPSLAFSRQEHWSGLPFSSPLRESEK